MGETREALEARIGVLTAFVGGILFELDEEGRYLAIRTGESELLAQPAEQLLGKTVADVFGEETWAKYVGVFRHVLDSGQPVTFEYTLEVATGRRSFRCQARSTPHDWKSAERRTVTLLVRDTTEETELRAKLVEAERRAAMGLVAASIGHEIRQPLAFATTSLEVLEGELDIGGASSARAHEALAHVRDALERIGTIARSVGVVAREKPHPETGDLRRPTMAAVDLCASQLQGRTRVVVDVPVLPPLHIDEGQLCQVITNVLLNAAHASDPARAPQNRIIVRAEAIAGGAKVRVSVEDDGCGIEPDHVARVFDPFFTTKAPGHGTGLGLFVSKRIVEDAGGMLEIASTPGQGTKVRITLPALPRKHAPRTRCSLLVVDDEPAFLRSLQLVLDDVHDVVVCSKSLEALEMVRAEPQRFDAVLCDLSMPHVDGVAFYKQMETLGIAGRFVLMTAGAFTPRAEEFIRQSKCMRIGKPFALEGLLTVIAAVADGARLH